MPCKKIAYETTIRSKSPLYSFAGEGPWVGFRI